eukprot:936344-Pelagomonas_calceolata.AAC.1
MTPKEHVQASSRLTTYKPCFKRTGQPGKLATTPPYSPLSKMKQHKSRASYTGTHSTSEKAIRKQESNLLRTPAHILRALTLYALVTQEKRASLLDYDTYFTAYWRVETSLWQEHTSACD